VPSVAESPFHPGFGQPPAYLAGRDAILEAGDRLIERAAAPGQMPSPLVLVGPRGVGKTVLLREIALRAGEQRGWPRIRLEVVTRRPLAPQITARAGELLVALPEHQRKGFQLDEVVARAGVGPLGAEAHFRRTESGGATAADDIEVALRLVAETLEDIGSGAVITVDETHAMERQDLNTLAAALQAGTELGWPFAVVLAGLASLRDTTAGVTYLERSEWHEVGFLDPGTTLTALMTPAQQAGKPMDLAAAQYLAEQSGGYPYAVQICGDSAWIEALDDEQIRLAHARAGTERAESRMAAGLYASRWNQASNRERQYLVALAEELGDGVVATGGSVAARLGGTTAQWSTYRARLMNKGTIFAEGGVLHFAVPGLQRYVLAHADDVRATR
jgi:hypothetical protein